MSGGISRSQFVLAVFIQPKIIAGACFSSSFNPIMRVSVQLFLNFTDFSFRFFVLLISIGSRCGLCDTYYIAHVKNACAFLGDGMSRIEVRSLSRLLTHTHTHTPMAYIIN